MKLEVLCSSKSSRQSSSSFEHLIENDSTVRFAGAEMRQRLATFIEFQLISKSHGSPWKQALANATDELCICIDIYMYYMCMCVCLCVYVCFNFLPAHASPCQEDAAAGRQWQMLHVVRSSSRVKYRIEGIG